MGAAYKLVVDGTEYTNDSGVVARIESEERREHHAITTLTAELIDPKWDIFSKVKDPAFDNIVVKLYLAKAGDARSQQVLVFDGKLTTMAVGYPERRTLWLTAHDNSIDARRQKSFKTFKGKNSVQVAKSIASLYSFAFDTSQVTDSLANLILREVDMGLNPNLSDWDHLQRALAADGMVAHVKGTKLYVTQAPSVVYATTFSRDRFPVISLNVTVQHVRGPGAQGDVKGSTVAFDGKGTQRAIKGADAKAADKEKASSRTGRRPIGGAATTSNNATHIEDLDGNKPEKVVDFLRKRKDSAQLVLLPTPDLSVLNNVRLSDWGGKVDGTWFVEGVKSTIVGGDGSATTTVSLMRGASPGAKKGAKLA